MDVFFLVLIFDSICIPIPLASVFFLQLSSIPIGEVSSVKLVYFFSVFWFIFVFASIVVLFFIITEVKYHQRILNMILVKPAINYSWAGN